MKNKITTSFKRKNQPKRFYAFKTMQTFGCVVCRKWYNTPSNPNLTYYDSSFIHIINTIRYKDTVCILPSYSNHDTCRELFELNPMAYL